MSVDPFPETRWSRILQAREDSYEEALQHVVRSYRGPIVAYLRWRGLPHEDAEDVAQEVFVQLCDGDLLRRADRTKGRFRTLLLRITKYLTAQRHRWLSRKKRGGDLERAPFLEAVFAEAENDSTDDQFNREWARNIVRRALDRLGKECDALSRPFHGALCRNLLEGQTYNQIAEEMGRPSTAIAYYIRQAKARLKVLISEEVAEYCSSTSEYREELESMYGFLFEDAP